jgi:hypothetical protein
MYVVVSPPQELPRISAKPSIGAVQMLPLQRRGWATDLLISFYLFLELLSCYTTSLSMRLCTLYPLCMMVKVRDAAERLNVPPKGLRRAC